MQEYEYVITDSVGLTDEALDWFRKGARSNSIRALVEMGADDLREILEEEDSDERPDFVGATIQVETKDGEVVGRFAYYVRREP